MHTSQLVLGTAQLGMRYGIAAAAAPDRAHAFAILEAALALGIERLDTAPGYGRAEAWIGEFRVAHRSSFRIASKLPALPAGIDAGALPAHVEAEVGASLARLQTERLDALLLHAPADLATHRDALVAPLAAEVERGRVTRIGVSAYSPDDAASLLRFPELSVLQHPLNLLDTRITADPVYPRLRSTHVELQARSVLLQGLLTQRPDAGAPARLGATAALHELATRLQPYGVSAVDVALPFVFAAGADAALIGVDSPAELEALVATLANPLPDALIDALAGITVDDGVIDPRRWPPRSR